MLKSRDEQNTLVSVFENAKIRFNFYEQKILLVNITRVLSQKSLPVLLIATKSYIYIYCIIDLFIST